LPKPASTRKSVAKTGAGAEKARGAKTAAVRTKGEKPAKKTVQEPVAAKRPPRSPADQSSVLNDLAAELKSDDEQVLLGAIDRLGGIDDSRATVHLVSCLRDPRYMVRIHAAAQLGEKKDATAVESLIGALHDDSLFVRQTAAGALENIGGGKALQAVRKAETEGLLLDDLPAGKRLTPEAEE